MTAVTNGCPKMLSGAEPLHNGPLHTAVSGLASEISTRECPSDPD